MNKRTGIAPSVALRFALLAAAEDYLSECGCCEQWHPKDFGGDCRDDANRFGTPEDFVDRLLDPATSADLHALRLSRDLAREQLSRTIAERAAERALSDALAGVLRELDPTMDGARWNRVNAALAKHAAARKEG